MAYTNAQVVRREAGDAGIFTRELFSGDGSTKDFFLRGRPILAASYAVKVGGTLKTETTDYTLDAGTGALTFVTAPASGTDNVAVTYTVVELADADITEALRLRGLVGTATADEGPAAAVLLAAADVLEWRWSAWLAAYDVSMDGQSMSRGKVADAIKAKAEALRVRARSFAGLSSSPVTVMDGYNRDEVDSRAVADHSINPRRRFYGQEDRVP